jgi:glycosyltransferase involved in cell wall biosynthesis
VAAYAATLAKICGRIGCTPEFLTARPANGALARFIRAAMPVMKIDREFSAPDVYRAGQVHFNLYRRPMPLRMADPPDLMHWTYPLPLVLNGCKNIVTIHDLIALYQPHLTGIDGDRLRRLLRIILNQFDGIIAVSETVRNEIIHSFEVSPARVRTIYQAADVTMLDHQAQPACPPGSFIVVGTVEARKNIRGIITAHKRSNVAAPLVIIGPDGEGAAEELAGIGDGVIRIPYLSRSVLLQTMRQARAILFPSLAEGFGLPIIEAFALGVPVMTSRGGATAEIAGEAALFVNPGNLDEITEAIQILAKDDEICKGLAARGLARSKIFTLEESARRLSDYYEVIFNN